METNKKNLILYADGSCRGNPGHGGSGVFGYTYVETTRPKNIKHPVKNNLYFTSAGIYQEKLQESIEVIDIIEIIKSINNPLTTNNAAELLAVVSGFEKAIQLEDICALTIYTDSNYIVTAYNDNLDRWAEFNWNKLDGKPVIHKNEWSKILQYRNTLTERNIKVQLIWVKGHSGLYGNETADLYSNIGSNSSRRQLTNNLIFNETVLDSVITYKQYKDSYLSKDFVCYFKDLYFTSSHIDDVNYCFLNTSENNATVGKRDVSSIFVTNIGFVPEIINRFKEIFRQEKRDYTVTGCIKLSKLEDKDIFRMTNIVKTDDLLTKVVTDRGTYFTMVGDSTPFLLENSIDYPFIMKASALFTKTLDIVNKTSMNLLIERDITEFIVKDAKIAFSNKDKHLNFSSLITDGISMKNELLITIGYDIPNYLTLKRIESDIKEVKLIIEKKPESNLCSVYTKIVTNDREIYSINIDNKFLALSV